MVWDYNSSFVDEHGARTLTGTAKVDLVVSAGGSVIKSKVSGASLHGSTQLEEDIHPGTCAISDKDSLAAGSVTVGGSLGDLSTNWPWDDDQVDVGDCSGEPSGHVDRVFAWTPSCTSSDTGKDGAVTYNSRFLPPFGTGGVGSQSTYTCKGTLKLAGSKPTVKVAVTVADESVSVGDSTGVKVKVSAGDAALDNVSLGSGLQAGGDLAEVTARPDGASGFSLAAHASRVFTYTVKALKAGAAALTVSATGKSKSGTATGRGSTTLRIAAGTLAVTMSVEPQTVSLTVDKNGKVEPKQVTVTVRVSNPGTTKLEHVSLQSVDPEPVEKGQALDQIALPRDALPEEIGELDSKAHATKTYKLKVTGDGKYQLRALVLYATPSGGTGRESAVGGKFEVVVPPLFFSAKREDDQVKGGTPWHISGRLANLSSYKDLCIAPMAPKTSGNAAATGPVDIVKQNLRDVGGPFGGELGPGKDVVLQMFIDTSAGGGTQSKVTLKPEAALIDPGTKCDEKTFKSATKLGEKDMTFTGDGPDFLVHVDVSGPPPEEASDAAFVGGTVLGIAKSLFVDTVKQALDLVALARDWHTTEAEYERMYPLAPPYAAHIAISTAQALQVATDVYATYWKTATEKEKGNLYYEVGNVLYNVSGDFFDDAEGTVKDAAAPFMDRLEKAYASGDDVAIGELWGEAAGSAIQQVVLSLFIEKAGATILADTAGLEEKAAQAGKDWAEGDAAKAVQEGEQATDSAADANLAKDSVRAGTELNLPEKGAVWGIDETTDTALTEIAKDCECLIGVRSRAPESIVKLEDGSVWKHENLKPKNVSDVDVEYLGFRQEDLSEVRFRTYTPEQEAAIRRRIAAADLTADERAAVLDRFETRLGEQKYVSTIEGYSKKGQINVGFNYRDNGIDRMTTKALRKFDLQSAAIPAEDGIPAGGTYYTPLQENPKYADLAKGGGTLPPNCKRLLLSVLCTVTGDVDGVYVTALDGSALPPDKLVTIYERLQAAGWQHPETLTWINNEGKFMFGSKEKILRGLEQGGEAMVEYAPDGVTRATYLNLDESTLVGPDNFHLRVVGGYHDATHAVAAK